MLILPELNIFLFSVLFLFISVSKIKENILTYAKLLSALAFLISLLSITENGELFSGAYRIDLFSQVFKMLIMAGFCLVILMFENKGEIEKEFLPEYFMFLGFSALGLMMLVSSVELISIVLSLEISSYSLYVILPIRNAQTKVQVEASMKYLFFGAVSTGVMLFGMGYLYGIAHSTFLRDIVLVLPGFLNQPIGIIALIFTLTGFFFKLSLFPMHFWSPDIYEGASNNTTTFIGTIPKLAAAALLIRITMLAFPGSMQIINILIILAALSMTFGNLVGLVQKDIKRLLAYSGIAHAGYLMMGILALSKDGNAAAIYYMTIYLFMNLACFYVVILLSKTGENVKIDDLAGLAKRSPLLALLLAVSAFSLAGIPPTGGFTGKLFLFTSAFEAGHLPIVIIGAVNTVISIYFYLNLVRIGYSKDVAVVEPLKLSFHEKVLCYFFIFLILYMGIMPSGIFEIFKASI
jgi:NADH-quinone oxidoreductase subunit N